MDRAGVSATRTVVLHKCHGTSQVERWSKTCIGDFEAWQSVHAVPATVGENQGNRRRQVIIGFTVFNHFFRRFLFALLIEKYLYSFTINRKRAGTVVAICCNLACLLSALLAPFMPTTAKQLRSQLGLSNKSYGYIPKTITNMLPTWHKIGKPSPLFTKIEDQKIEMLRNKYAGQQETNGEGSAASKTSVDSIAALEAAITKQVSRFGKLIFFRALRE